MRQFEDQKAWLASVPSDVSDLQEFVDIVRTFPFLWRFPFPFRYSRRLWVFSTALVKKKKVMLYFTIGIKA